MSDVKWVSFAAIIPGVEGDAYLTMTRDQAAAYYRMLPGADTSLNDYNAYIALKAMVHVRRVAAPDFVASVNLKSRFKDLARMSGGYSAMRRQLNVNDSQIDAMCEGRMEIPTYIAKKLGIVEEVRFVDAPKK
ncbi:hypothetical protein PLUTO_00300 [Luteibacter phage vB_LflM-Pluto]|uniref:Uncharacterized protein n=1 Tax=Luteibacter phage vB_LflM-Pluto TaxID=2948611 RepID=A0A9E7SLY2_9CAUD|nr:hypothetical protein PLUTO_00300 [Luteibacter phage vB_LflM-Pluto]